MAWGLGGRPLRQRGHSAGLILGGLQQSHRVRLGCLKVTLRGCQGGGAPGRLGNPAISRDAWAVWRRRRPLAGGKPSHFLQDGSGQGPGSRKGLVSSPHPTRHPVHGSSPAAAEKEQAVHGWDGGAGILACDEVAVQHHVHSVGLTGCGRSRGRGPQTGSRARHALTTSPHSLPGTPRAPGSLSGSELQPLAGSPTPAHH